MEHGGPVIETRGLMKRFGDVNAIAGVELRVPRGGVYGFLGPNGAGKTTTIRILLGLIRATRGTSWVFGEAVAPGAPVLARVGALVERPAFYPYLSATDNLRLLGNARGMQAVQIAGRVPEALDRVGLADAARRQAGRFSTGMKQRLGIAAALLDRPDLVILDEPTSGLDPNGVVDVRRLIAGLAAEGVTVFLSSHVLPEVEQVCDRVAILQAGRIIAEGETQTMLRQGERLFVGFEGADEAARARPILERIALVESAVEGPRGLLVDAPPGTGSQLMRALGEAGIYPAELSVRRPSLESVFIELLEDRTQPAEVSPASSVPAPSGPIS